MRIALVDDQKNDILHLKACLEKFEREQGLDFEVVCFSDSESFFQSYEHNFDFIIFDIDMPGMNGMDAAKKLRKMDSNVAIMFVTNMPQYAIDGYSVEAVDYILKPISYSEIALKMQKALRFIKRNTDYHVNINSVDGFVSMCASDIYYLESNLHYVTYHTSQGEIRSRVTLNELEPLLSPYHFARCSVSYLVNLKHIKSMNGDMLILPDASVKISRGKKKSFLCQFTKYIGGI